MIYKTQANVVFLLMLIMTGSLTLAQTKLGKPVSYIIEAPETVSVGERFTITAVFNIEPGWYVYAPIIMNTAQGKIPTKVSFKVPEDFKKIDELELPNQRKSLDIYRGNNIRMSQKFEVDKNALLGRQTIKANVVYQTCNNDICYPPIRKKMDIVITIK